MIQIGSAALNACADQLSQLAADVPNDAFTCSTDLHGAVTGQIRDIFDTLQDVQVGMQTLFLNSEGFLRNLIASFRKADENAAIGIQGQ